MFSPKLWNEFQERLQKYRPTDENPHVEPLAVKKSDFPIKDLPGELLMLIFSWCNYSDALQFRQVSRQWKEIATQSLLWKSYFFTSKGLQQKWSCLGLPKNVVNIHRIFETGTFHQELSRVSLKKEMQSFKRKRREDITRINVVVAKKLKTNDDYAVATLLLPKRGSGDWQKLKILDISEKSFVKSTLYIALSLIGKKAESLTQIVAYRSNFDDLALDLVQTHCRQIRFLDLRQTEVSQAALKRFRNQASNELKLIA